MCTAVLSRPNSGLLPWAKAMSLHDLERIMSFIRVPYTNPVILGVIGPGFLNQVPTLVVTVIMITLSNYSYIRIPVIIALLQLALSHSSTQVQPPKPMLAKTPIIMPRNIHTNINIGKHCFVKHP